MIGAACLLGLSPLAAQTQADRGRAIFEGKGGCAKCHAIENRGGSLALGPDLSEIGVKRTPESLRLSITNPNDDIDEEYRTVVITTKEERRIEGLGLNEDDLSIQIRDREGNLRSFLKSDLTDVHREERSLMPSYSSRLPAPEIAQLVAYLRTLRGTVEPVAATPRERQSSAFSDTVEWMNRASREGDEMPETLLDNLQIPPGTSVADVGCGSGYFTWRLAQRAGPKGKVVAVEIRQEMLDFTAQEAKKHGLQNVQLILGTDRDPKLARASFDVVFLANTYHEFTEPAAMMKALRQALKPSGRLIVVEYAKETENDDPTAGVATMSASEIRSEIEPIGFQLERISDVVPAQNVMIFSKRR